MRRIYLDHCATTPARTEVLEAMLPFFGECFGNPSSIHSFGKEPREAVEAARSEVAAVLGCSADEIVFTGGGTESDNLAIKGVVLRDGGRRRHVVTSAVEHKAVMETCRFLEKDGVEVTYLPVDGQGLVSPDDLRAAIGSRTLLVSIMHANNETGVLQPIGELARVAREAGVPFHTDAVQSFGKVPVEAAGTGVSLLSVAGHKIYGPKGVGALYVRKGLRLAPFFHGGHHENGRRAGTENVPGIVGLGAAARCAAAEMDSEAARLEALRDALWLGLSQRVDGLRLNGHPVSRLPHVASVSVEGVEGEAMLLKLDLLGVAASAGSACTSDSLEASHVLTAMGLDPATANGTLRFSLGRSTTAEDIDFVVGAMPGIVERLRAMSPLV